MFEVMIATAFRKSTVRPWPSVSRPSSSTWSSALKTLGWAFSSSSKRTTEWGRRRTASVSCPPSSKPTYPGGAPTSLDTECASPYSDMSRRTMARSSSKRNSARARAVSVFPTPVGPRNRNDPTGRFGSCTPARARRTARDTAPNASSCPTTRFASSASSRAKRLRSESTSRVTGMPVHSATTSATSSAVTSSLRNFPSAWSASSRAWAASISAVALGISEYWTSATRSSSPRRVARSASVRSPSTFSLSD